MLEQKYFINKSYVINELDKKAIILEPTGREIYILKEEEYNILMMFNGSRSFESIVKQLEKDYQVTGIEQDVTNFVNQLIDKGIICCGDI